MEVVPTPSCLPVGQRLGSHWSHLVTMLQGQRIDLVLDVGANVGQHALALRASGYHGRILSIEPVAAAYSELVRATNEDIDWIALPRMAVGAHPGTLTINVSANSDMSSALPFAAEAQRGFASDHVIAHEAVDVSTIDRLMTQYAAPDQRVFLKSDTQGYDLEVLRGAARSLERIVGVQIETSLCPTCIGQADWRSIVDFLAPYRFEIHLVIPGYFSRASGRLMEMDLVFFRDDCNVATGRSAVGCTRDDSTLGHSLRFGKSRSTNGCRQQRQLASTT
jgi:FkbM family methyltransferase